MAARQVVTEVTVRAGHAVDGGSCGRGSIIRIGEPIQVDYANVEKANAQYAEDAAAIFSILSREIPCGTRMALAKLIQADYSWRPQ